VVHFSDVVASTFKVAIIRHPLKYFGLPGLLLLAGSFAFGLWDLDVYSRQGRLVTNLTLISIGMAVMGVILFAAGMILFAMITVLREHQEF